MILRPQSSQRVRWRLHRLFGVELARLRDKLQDLLPPTVAARLLEAPPPPPPPSPGPGGGGGGGQIPPTPARVNAGGGAAVPPTPARGGGRPSASATAAAALGARWRSACEAYTAVVVQADICRFTQVTYCSQICVYHLYDKLEEFAKASCNGLGSIFTRM